MPNSQRKARRRRRRRRHPRLYRLEALEARNLLVAVGEVVPDFALADVNETSGTYNTSVSPRQYAQQATAWYFGHAL